MTARVERCIAGHTGVRREGAGILTVFMKSTPNYLLRENIRR